MIVGSYDVPIAFQFSLLNGNNVVFQCGSVTYLTMSSTASFVMQSRREMIRMDSVESHF